MEKNQLEKKGNSKTSDLIKQNSSDDLPIDESMKENDQQIEEVNIQEAKIIDQVTIHDENDKQFKGEELVQQSESNEDSIKESQSVSGSAHESNTEENQQKSESDQQQTFLQDVDQSTVEHSKIVIEQENEQIIQNKNESQEKSEHCDEPR